MKTASITALLLLHLTLSLGVPSIGKAAAPPLLPVQGYLTDDADMPLNGVYKISFTLFDADTAGTSLFTTTEPVALTKGRFTVYLGDKQQLQLDKLHHANAVWLEVTIVQSCATDATCASPTAVNKTLSPRLQLASTAYAASAAFCSSADNAQALGGMSVSELQPKIADVACGPNMFVSGLQGGMPVCAGVPATTSSGSAPAQTSLPNLACPAGQLLSGIQGGQPVCVPRPMDGKNASSIDAYTKAETDARYARTKSCYWKTSGCPANGTGDPPTCSLLCDTGDIVMTGGCAANAGGSLRENMPYFSTAASNDRWTSSQMVGWYCRTATGQMSEVRVFCCPDI